MLGLELIKVSKMGPSTKTTAQQIAKHLINVQLRVDMCKLGWEKYVNMHLTTRAFVQQQ